MFSRRLRLRPAGHSMNHYLLHDAKLGYDVVAMDSDEHTLLRVTTNPGLAYEWELVLLAQGLSPTLWKDTEGVGLSVPEDQAERARASLEAYDLDNPAEPARRSTTLQTRSFIAGGAVGLSLLICFALTVYLPAIPWLARGSADAEHILHGELWRTATALLLHADIVHALSNAAAIGLFFGALSSMTGIGLAGALILLAGVVGNLVNAVAHGVPHDSIGASTAVFGAVGLLGGFAFKRHRQFPGQRRAWLAIGAALGLLAMLGSGGGPRVDIFAHLFGLISGVVISLFVAAKLPRLRDARTQQLCGIGAIAILLACWILAILVK